MNENMTGFEVRVYGDSRTELEAAALEAARGFFGDGVSLAVTPNYTAHEQQPLLGTEPHEGKFYADIRVVSGEG